MTVVLNPMSVAPIHLDVVSYHDSSEQDEKCPEHAQDDDINGSSIFQKRSFRNRFHAVIVRTIENIPTQESLAFQMSRSSQPHLLRYDEMSFRFLHRHNHIGRSLLI